MTKEEMIAINDTLELIIQNSSTCSKCILQRKNTCFFGYQCITNDFCCFKETNASEEIKKIIDEKRKER